MAYYNQASQYPGQGQYIRRDYHVNTGGYHNHSHPQQNSIMIERHYIPIDLYREMYGLPPQRTTTHSVPPPGYPTVNRHNIWDTNYLFDLYSPFYDLGNLNTGVTTANTNANTSANTSANTANTGDNTANATNATNATNSTNTSNTPRATFIPTSSTNTSSNSNNRNTTNTGSPNSYNDLLTNIFNRYIERTMATNVTNNVNTSPSNNASGNATAGNATTAGTTTQRPRGYVELQMFDNLSDTPTVISSNISNGAQGTQLMTSIINAFTTLNNRRNGDNGDNENQHGLTAQEIFDNTTLHIFNDELSDEIDEDEDPKCSICQEEFSDGQRLRRIEECEHYFHKSCIDTWFTTHDTCPMCRASVVVDLD